MEICTQKWGGAIRPTEIRDYANSVVILLRVQYFTFVNDVIFNSPTLQQLRL
jgi:hypothetical protein